MIVHPRRRPRPQVSVPMTSLIDMVFLLLIYFLLTASFMTEGGITVRLPRARTSGSRGAAAITVCISRDGRFSVGGREMSAAELSACLGRMIARNRERLVVVRADRAVPLDLAVRALDLAKAAGARRLTLATERGS